MDISQLLVRLSKRATTKRPRPCRHQWITTDSTRSRLRATITSARCINCGERRTWTFPHGAYRTPQGTGEHKKPTVKE